MAKNFSDLSKYDADFVSDADLEDGFEESDMSRMEREKHEADVRAYKAQLRAEREAKKVEAEAATEPPTTPPDDYTKWRNGISRDADRYNNLSTEEARGMSDEELCRLYDAAMIEKDLADDEDDKDVTD